MARPFVKIDEKQEKQVETLAAIGCIWTEIAAVTGLKIKTLQRHCGLLYKKGRERLNSSIRRMQYESASKGNVTMQIWLGKQYLGQTDKNEFTGGKEPIKIKVEYV